MYISSEETKLYIDALLEESGTEEVTLLWKPNKVERRKQVKLDTIVCSGQDYVYQKVPMPKVAQYSSSMLKKKCSKF